METNTLPMDPKNTFTFPLRKDGPLITLSSNFDSGNLAQAQIGFNSSIIITPANDCSSSSTPSHSKGWFHFSLNGAPPQTKIKFIIKKMSNLCTQQKFSDYFRPVYKVAGEEWTRIEHAIVFTKQEDAQLHFDFIITKHAEVRFAYSYPFSYEDCQKMLKNILRDTKNLKHIYYKDEIMIKTAEGRSVHLLTVTSTDDKCDYKEDKINEHLFNHGDRPDQFKPSKKVLLITARVHPGESPSSHTFNGLLKFLLSNDARAHYLRKYFLFRLVPMINPDGVYHGHYRMDTFGKNLNRFYIDPDVQKQPAVFAIKKLGQFYHKRETLVFYIDLHAHPQKKGNFIYGNSMQNTQQQVQTQLFAKLLSLNCIEFDYFNSSFSKYHMNAKDKNQDLTKEGCGRVVFNTHFQMKHTYTMECGYTASGYLNEICPIQNNHRKFQKYPIIFDQLENIKSPYYNGKKNVYFTIRNYQNLGKNILVSILDLFQLNPASRLPNTPMKNLQGVRQEIQDQLNKASMAYIKLNRTPMTQNNIRSLKTGLNNQRIVRGHFVRGPSIESSKEIPFNKLRNRTIAKVNIGNFP